MTRTKYHNWFAEPVRASSRRLRSPDAQLNSTDRLLLVYIQARAAGHSYLTESLKQVKSLYDQSLINKEDYDKRAKEIMDSL